MVVKRIPDSLAKQHVSRAGSGNGGPPKLFYGLTSQLPWDVESIWAAPSSPAPPRISKGYADCFVFVFGGYRGESGTALLFYFIFIFKRKPDIFRGID